MADDSTLFKAVNNWASNLTNGINDTTTTITLDSVVGLPTTGGVLTFTDNKEIIHYTSISGNDLTVTRGYDNTTATAHSAGIRVEMRSIAAHHNVLKDEILSLDENQGYTESPMVVSGGEISEGTTGTFTVAAGTGLFRTTDSVIGALAKASWSEFANQPITDPYTANTTYFICLNYNGGSPTISLSETNPYTADKRNIPIGRVMKDGSDNIHFISGGFGFQDGIKKLHTRAITLRNLELNGGSTISYKADNYFTMAAGVAFGGINKFSLDAYDSSVTTYIPIRTDGATFIEDTTRNTIDYLHYDKGDGTLGNVGTAKYGVFWIYRHIDDGDVYVRYPLNRLWLSDR